MCEAARAGHHATPLSTQYPAAAGVHTLPGHAAGLQSCTSAHPAEACRCVPSWCWWWGCRVARLCVSCACSPGCDTLYESSQIMKEDDNNWPMPDRVGKQELEIKMNGEHICFNTTKLGSVLQVQQSKDPDGLRIFYYLVQVCVDTWGVALWVTVGDCGLGAARWVGAGWE